MILMKVEMLLLILQKIADNPEIVLNLLQALDVDKKISFINIPIRVMNKKVFWDVLAESDGWELQRHKITNHARIIDNSNIRRAWGTVDGMYEVMERLMDAEKKYSHFAVTHGDGNTLIEKLKNCKEMLDSGLIKQEDYDEMKKKILEQII